MLARWLVQLGFSRDDEIWVWGRIVGAAALIASGGFDLTYWAQYVGVPMSPQATHIITFIAVAVLWISGKQATSQLPADPAKH